MAFPFWDGRANALLVHPKQSHGPLWVLDAEDFIPIVWDGDSSFYIHLAQSFVPTNDACYFYLRVLRSAQGGYVWAPEQHRDKIRVSDGAQFSPSTPYLTFSSR